MLLLDCSDPKTSPDPQIQALAQKRDSRLAALRTIEAQLRVYASQTTPAPEPRPAIDPQEHYNMLDQAECGCKTCTDWQQRREEFIRAVKLIPKDHKWTICPCPTCRFVGRFQLNLLAAANRRELLIEMSFHARFHSRHGDLVMKWLEEEMKKPSYTDNWYAQELNRYPMERWITRCENAVSGMASGKVFVTSTMRTDMIEYFPSTLFADVDSSNWFG